MSEEKPTPIEIRDEFRDAYWRIRGDVQALASIMDGLIIMLALERAKFERVGLDEVAAELRRRLLVDVEADIVRIDGVPEDVKVEHEEHLHVLMIEAARKFLHLDES